MRTARSRLRTIVNQDGAVLLDSTTGTIMALNATGAFVWQRLERGENPDVIVQELAVSTGREVGAVEHDVRQFLQVLRDRHLLAP